MTVESSFALNKLPLSLQQDGVVAALLEAHASAFSLLHSRSHFIVSIVGEVTSQSICNIWCNTIMVLVKWQRKRSSAIAILSSNRSLGIWRWLTSKHWSEKASERRRPMWRLSVFRYAHSYTFLIMSRPSAVLSSVLFFWIWAPNSDIFFRLTQA